MPISISTPRGALVRDLRVLTCRCRFANVLYGFHKDATFMQIVRFTNALCWTVLFSIFILTVVFISRRDVLHRRLVKKKSPSAHTMLNGDQRTRPPIQQDCFQLNSTRNILETQKNRKLVLSEEKDYIVDKEKDIIINSPKQSACKNTVGSYPFSITPSTLANNTTTLSLIHHLCYY